MLFLLFAGNAKHVNNVNKLSARYINKPKPLICRNSDADLFPNIKRIALINLIKQHFLSLIQEIKYEQIKVHI